MHFDIIIACLALIVVSLSALRLNREVRRMQLTINDLRKEVKRNAEIQKEIDRMTWQIETVMGDRHLQLDYLRRWASQADGTAHIDMINNLHPSNITSMYHIVHDYLAKGRFLPIGLQDIWNVNAAAFGLASTAFPTIIREID